MIPALQNHIAMPPFVVRLLPYLRPICFRSIGNHDTLPSSSPLILGSLAGGQWWGGLTDSRGRHGLFQWASEESAPFVRLNGTFDLFQQLRAGTAIGCAAPNEPLGCTVPCPHQVATARMHPRITVPSCGKIRSLCHIIGSETVVGWIAVTKFDVFITHVFFSYIRLALLKNANIHRLYYTFASRIALIGSISA